MMLWDIIRNFFVEYIFGGVSNSTGEFQYFGGCVGYFWNNENDLSGHAETSTIYLPINVFNENEGSVMNYISIGDWLSTTATIITLIGLCFFLFLVLRWCFRLTSGLLQGK